ncbi:protoglobin domain-containing protein [Hydrogenibacillus schlegelii]|uniref:Protogloblin ApPgb n=1 Tax=Hydrogenibacillus schlegelii TaxID=1484 RepID=A0A132N9Y3_HYDSH|nr:protoglobin domain-containing protein [Hydrogenibacillus schlegelii]KWX06985.1 protogloblin ApPgb [Hydrogenibacillus schlegelii]OAR03303.1 protogloblin ApPgb [Hydrogenibacillus schlegelii]
MTIPGYMMGSPTLPPAPLKPEEIEEIKKTLTLTDDDLRFLRMSLPIVEAHADEILDVWYGFVGSHPHLLYYFSRRDGTPNETYLARVRQRFKQWIIDTAQAEYDDAWLRYQFEIGRRHHRTGKNKTDGVDSVPHIHFRHLFALAIPVLHTLKPFLARGSHDTETVERIFQAWQKAVLFQLILWSYPYVKEGDY